MVRKKHLFLGVLIAMCLICVSGLCACNTRGGGATLVDFPATATEIVQYKDMYTCKSTVADTNGNVYPVDYEVTDSQGAAVKTRNGAFPVLDVTYTVKYTAHVADDNMPTSTVEIKTDSLEPTVMMSEISDGFADFETTLPAATYKDDWNLGGITDYTLYYLGTAENAVQEEREFTPADPDAEVKNGGKFTPTEVGNYKVVVTGSDKSDEVSVEHSVSIERTFAIGPNPIGGYVVENGKLVDFEQEAIQYFLRDSEATVSLVDSMTEQVGEDVIGLPYADKEDDKTVLKVVGNSTTGWQERGGVHGAVIQKSLSALGEGNIANKLVRFKYYVDPACTSNDIRLNLRWAITGDVKSSVEFRPRPGKWTEFSFVIHDFNPIVGLTEFTGHTADDLADITNYLAFFCDTGNPASDVTFYVSDFYIEDATYATNDSVKTLPYDFSNNAVLDYARGFDYTYTSIVEASTIGAETTPDGAPTGTDKVLSVGWGNNPNRLLNTNPNFITYRVLDAEPLRQALLKMTDEELQKATMTYWLYHDNGGHAAGVMLRFLDLSTTGSETRRGDSTNKNSKQWIKCEYPLSTLIGTDSKKGFNCTREQLAHGLDYIILYPDCTYAGTLYISNIRIVYAD